MFTPIKVIIVGEPHVGKTSIAQRTIDDAFSPIYTKTIGIEFFISSVTRVNNCDVKLQIWDTGYLWPGILPSIYAKSAVVVVIYSVTDRASFEATEEHFDRINRFSPMARRILVGNKCDEERVVGMGEGAAVARVRGAVFLEVDSKTGTAIPTLGSMILRAGYSHVERNICER